MFKTDFRVGMIRPAHSEIEGANPLDGASPEVNGMTSMLLGVAIELPSHIGHAAGRGNIFVPQCNQQVKHATITNIVGSDDRSTPFVVLDPTIGI